MTQTILQRFDECELPRLESTMRGDESNELNELAMLFSLPSPPATLLPFSKFEPPSLFDKFACLELLHDPESAWCSMSTDLEADLLQLTNEYWQMLASMQHDMEPAISQPENELFPGPPAIFPPDLYSTQIESDFCSSIVTVQRMPPLRLFKIRWNLESLISPSL